jgi:hypothetical protein
MVEGRGRDRNLFVCVFSGICVLGIRILVSASPFQALVTELNDFGYEPRMQRWLIIPDLLVQAESLRTESRFREFKSFIASDLDGGAEWDKRFEGEIKDKDADEGNPGLD